MQTTQISLVSEDTGNAGDPLFSIYDIYTDSQNAKGIVEYFNLTHTIQEASNAIIEVDGERKETLGNRFTFNSSIEVALKSTTQDSFAIKVEHDNAKLSAKLSAMTDAYNALVDLARTNKDNFRSVRILHQLNSVSHRYESVLGNAGLLWDSTDHLQVDSKEIDTATETGGLKSFFSPDNRFVADLKSIADNIRLNPMEYVDKIIIAYPNMAAGGSINPYAVSIYSGLLFNSYC
jgi:flagellar hook-associated protein 2